MPPKRKTPGKRGKRKRRHHVIYAIESALGFNHGNIAYLSQPGFLSIQEIKAACQHPLSPLPHSTLPAAAVAKMISGEYSKLWTQAKKRLSYRLGIKMSSVDQYEQTGKLLSDDGSQLTKTSVLKSLAEKLRHHEEDLQNGWRMSRVEAALRFPDKLTLLD